MLAGSITYSKLTLQADGDGKIVNADIKSDAAIAYSKLSLGTSILNSDISTSAAIAYSKLDLSTSIVNADISGTAAIEDSKLATISTAGKVDGGAINTGTITGDAIWNTTGNITTTGTISDGTGSIRQIPQNAQTAAYELDSSDVGKHISITTGGITIPVDTFSVGDNVTIFNNSTSNQSIAIAEGGTLRSGGSTVTGTRTLANYGVATILCVADDVFVITGTGIS